MVMADVVSNDLLMGLWLKLFGLVQRSAAIFCCPVFIFVQL